MAPCKFGAALIFNRLRSPSWMTPTTSAHRRP